MKNCPPWEKDPVFCFTSDIDWASEDIIKYSHNILSGDDLKLTYFNTHPSEFLEKLKESQKIKLLIHPNFLPNSSHGDSYEEVINYCLNLVPGAEGFRSHRYFEVNDIMDSLAARGVKYSSNVCTRCSRELRPYRHRSGLVSIPIFLEDGGYLLMEQTLNFEKLIHKLSSPGLKVINFHPAHMAFNTPRFSYTREIKDRLTRESWNNMTNEDIKKIENHKIGIRDIILNIIKFVKNNGYLVLSMQEIYDIFNTHEPIN